MIDVEEKSSIQVELTEKHAFILLADAALSQPHSKDVSHVEVRCILLYHVLPVHQPEPRTSTGLEDDLSQLGLHTLWHTVDRFVQH